MIQFTFTSLHNSPFSLSLSSIQILSLYISKSTKTQFFNGSLNHQRIIQETEVLPLDQLHLTRSSIKLHFPHSLSSANSVSNRILLHHTPYLHHRRCNFWLLGRHEWVHEVVRCPHVRDGVHRHLPRLGFRAYFHRHR